MKEWTERGMKEGNRDCIKEWTNQDQDQDQGQGASNAHEEEDSGMKEEERETSRQLCTCRQDMAFWMRDCK